MVLKGVDKFWEKVPSLSGWKIFLLPGYAFCIISFCIMFMIGFDSLPDILKLNGADSNLLFLFPLIGELMICITGFVLVFQMWFWKDRLKARYGQASYQRILPVGFTGICCVLSLSINMFVHYWSFSPSFWMSSPLRFLAVPLDSYFYPFGNAAFIAKTVVSVFLAALGLTMIIRSLLTFGFDYMTVIYLYFPEESKIQNHRIYSVLRHPTYTGALTIGLGGMFFTLTPYSIIFFIVYLTAFYFHIHFVEEKELVARFGPSYQHYMKQVPAFLVKPDKLGDFLGFLMGRDN